ncbi:unnamed protein product [Periconia digitata]|uniref:Uncharacterized protein n=1 Tax=Periconia digitata TaxID=1303443 RepID=A0A9W4XKN7_9PLEO|nr:unnamed protein product [Periconia digitata]
MDNLMFRLTSGSSNHNVIHRNRHSDDIHVHTTVISFSTLRNTRFILSLNFACLTMSVYFFQFTRDASYVSWPQSGLSTLHTVTNRESFRCTCLLRIASTIRTHSIEP